MNVSVLQHYLFRHREIPDIRLQDLDLSKEFDRLERFVKVFEPQSRPVLERYEHVAGMLVRATLENPQSLAFGGELVRDVVDTILSVKGLRRRQLDNGAIVELELMTEYGFRLANRVPAGMGTRAPVAVPAVYIGALARLSNLADRDNRPLCAMGLQEGLRVAITSNYCFSKK
jgi:hypothetical protein